MSLSLPPRKRNQMEEYLEFVNMLPLDKKGKIEFVCAHVERLKQYEEETKENKNNFEKCLQEIKCLGHDTAVFCLCCDEMKQNDT